MHFAFIPVIHGFFDNNNLCVCVQRLIVCWLIRPRLLFMIKRIIIIESSHFVIQASTVRKVKVGRDFVPMKKVKVQKVSCKFVWFMDR